MILRIFKNYHYKYVFSFLEPGNLRKQIPNVHESVKVNNKIILRILNSMFSHFLTSCINQFDRKIWFTFMKIINVNTKTY